MDTIEDRLEDLERRAGVLGMQAGSTIAQLDRLTRDFRVAQAELHETRKVIRPSVDELHRRAVLEAELAENASHLRHRIDRFENRIERQCNDVEYRVFRLEHPWRYRWIDLCAKVKLWTGGRLG